MTSYTNLCHSYTLQNLISVAASCPGHLLSILNGNNFPNLTRAVGLEGVVNAIGKLNGYVELIKTTLSAENTDSMQAIHDVLVGIVQDLYNLVSVHHSK